MRNGRRRGTLDAKQCALIRDLRRSGILVSVLAERFGVSGRLISRIVNDPDYVPPQPKELEPLK